MLSHLPPLPIIIDYDGREPLSAKDEEGVLLALQKHDRIRRIHLCASTGTTLDKLFAVLNGSLPLLDNLGLCIEPSNADENESVSNELELPRLPQSFQAPHLDHLDLSGVGNLTEVGLPLLATLFNLVSLTLAMTPASRYLSLNYLTLCLSLMPQLKHLDLVFEFCVLSDDIARKPINNPPNVRQIPLSNLTGFFFHGDSSYLEALAARITVPHITTFNATFLDEPSSTLPHLSGLLTTAAGLRFPTALIKFSSPRLRDPMVTIWMANSEQTLGHQQLFPPFRIGFPSSSLYAQVTSAGKMCTALTPMLSEVGILHLYFNETRSWSLHDRPIDNARWYALLRPFREVKKLHVDGQLWGLSRALSPDDSGPSMEILPELRKILRWDGARFSGAFDGFIAARRDAGQHIVKRWRTLYSDGEGREGEDGRQEDNEGRFTLGFADERGEDEESSSSTYTGSDLDFGTDHEPGILTEIDSDSDSDSESMR